MSYKVLALKYRPQTFAAVVGQQATLLALQHALDKNQLHHAYLFTGTRGVGKTTLARLLAKSLNCVQGVSSTPCGVCDSCQSIAAGTNIDVLEIDAASRTKVEDTRDLLDNVPYAPVQSRYKIYIIDEVHMLSNHSFNALLKTLEEPPAHVKFILATTDPQKLPITVLSRCLQFQLRDLTKEQISKHLLEVLQQEAISYEEQAVLKIAQCANGSMRDALSLLEQVIALGQEQVTTKVCQDLLGTDVESHAIELLTEVVNNNPAKVITRIRDFASLNMDFNLLLKQLQTCIHQMALLQVVPEEDVAPELVDLAKQVDAVDLQLYYQTTLHGVRDLPYAPNIVLGFEMLMLRMLAFKPVAVNYTEQANSAASAVKAAPIAPVKMMSTTAETPNIPVPPIPMKATVSAPTSEALLHQPANKNDWGDIIARLKLSGLTKVVAENCTIATWGLDSIVLNLHESQKALLNPKHTEKIEAALQEYLRNKVKLTINIVGTQNNETPAAVSQRTREVNASAAENALRSDMHLQQLKQTFAAKITDIHIKENN